MINRDWVDLDFTRIIAQSVHRPESNVDMVSAPVGHLATGVFIEPTIVSMSTTEVVTGSPAFNIYHSRRFPVRLDFALALPQIPVEMLRRIHL